MPHYIRLCQKSPIFVVGFFRSGTTFLAELLNRHSNIAIPSETQFFREFLPNNNSIEKLRWNPGVSPWVATFSHSGNIKEDISRLLSNRWFADIDVLADEIYAELLGVKMPVYKDIFIAFLSAYAKRRGKTRFGEKSPMHLFYVDKIMNWYPNAKIICIIRDGRDAILSLMPTPWFKGNVLRYCADWNYRARLALQFASRYRESFKLVRYEDLLTNPEQMLLEICRFVDEEFEVIQLKPSGDSGVVPEWEKGWKQKALLQIDTSRRQVWKKSDNTFLIEMMTVCMKKYLHKFDYAIPQHNKLNLIKQIYIRVVSYLYHETIYIPLHLIREKLRDFYYLIGIKKFISRADVIDKLMSVE